MQVENDLLPNWPWLSNAIRIRDQGTGTDATVQLICRSTVLRH